MGTAQEGKEKENAIVPLAARATGRVAAIVLEAVQVSGITPLILVVGRRSPAAAPASTQLVVADRCRVAVRVRPHPH